MIEACLRLARHCGKVVRRSPQGVTLVGASRFAICAQVAAEAFTHCWCARRWMCSLERLCQVMTSVVELLRLGWLAPKTLETFRTIRSPCHTRFLPRAPLARTQRLYIGSAPRSFAPCSWEDGHSMFSRFSASGTASGTCHRISMTLHTPETSSSSSCRLTRPSTSGQIIVGGVTASPPTGLF